MEQLTGRLQETIGALGKLDRQGVHQLCDQIIRTHAEGGTVFACGNGGSACTASHFCQDLGKATITGAGDDGRLRVVSLTDSVSALTAWANDHGYDTVFEQPLRALGRAGDLLVAFSGSGNSRNVLNAVRYANSCGIATFALTGFDGGELKRLARDGVHVEVRDMAAAENAHMVIAHLAIAGVRDWKLSLDRG
jgi:D-sedoheptulose 7-phosphate isomerase